MAVAADDLSCIQSRRRCRTGIYSCLSVGAADRHGRIDARGDVLGDRQYGQFAVERIFRRANA